ncbi:codeine O-demethylase-like isoform X3 [Diospyros lotus]|uniref:codeine O-demethylase-like isoform X3 n=1 Tax=Diospyros lotus TaxID=55363 RepID=UPI00224C867C|nr:codeine O-demethylase-like isoform X3 [Diospyros lotus]
MSKAKLTGDSIWSQLPSVLELAKRPLNSIPDRYLHPQQDTPILFNSSSSSLPQIPVIDLQSLFSADSMASELHKLHSACKDWGFFQVINHGVSSELLEKVRVEIQGLFELPLEEKQKYWRKEGGREGFGQLFVVSEEQTLDWADVFTLVTSPNYLRNPELFPILPPSFRETVEQYSAEMKKLATSLFQLMAKALKMENGLMEELFGEGIQTMGMNYYPPFPKPEQVVGLSSHSDASALTVLYQLNQVEGLQIKKNGIWLPISPIRYAFTINIGDALEIVTNGTYKSIEHRAVINAEKERLSIATFHGPNVDGEFGPAASLVTPQTPALFQRVCVKDYYQKFLTNKLDEKSNIDRWRINRIPDCRND